MGSTSRRNHYDEPTTAPARNLVLIGQFALAKQELDTYRSDTLNMDVMVMLAICEYRMGTNPAALTELRSSYGPRLTASHETDLCRHEVLGLIERRQFEDATRLLLSWTSLTNAERDALAQISRALWVLQGGQKTAIVKLRPERGGLVTPSEARSKYLPVAEAHCLTAIEPCALDGSLAERLIYVLGNYMLLLIELSMNKGMRRTSNIREYRMRLGSVDAGIRKSLPALRHWKHFVHRF